MKINIAFVTLVAFTLTFLLSSCEVIGGIFKAGMWTAFLIMALVVGLIIWIVARMRRK